MLADRVGRARLLMVMVAWFAFFTFLSGFTNSFEQLLVVRGFQGFGFGGEWAAGSVLIGESSAAPIEARRSEPCKAPGPGAGAAPPFSPPSSSRYCRRRSPGA